MVIAHLPAGIKHIPSSLRRTLLAGEELLVQSQQPPDLCNQGNALAQLGRYAHAVAAYQQALKTLAPGHSALQQDIQHNLKLVEEALKQQQNSEQKQDSRESAAQPPSG